MLANLQLKNHATAFRKRSTELGISSTRAIARGGVDADHTDQRQSAVAVWKVHHRAPITYSLAHLLMVALACMSTLVARNRFLCETVQ